MLLSSTQFLKSMRRGASQGNCLYTRAFLSDIQFETVVVDLPYINKQNRLTIVYTHFKSCDQSLDKTFFDFPNILRARQSCATNAKSSIILKPPMSFLFVCFSLCFEWA